MTTAILGPPASRERSGRRGRAWRFLLVAALLVVGLATGLAIAASGGPSSAPVSVSVRPAPLFRLAPVGGSGPSVTLAAAAGRPVIVSFFASWCDGCQQEMATMGQVAGLARGVEVIGVDVNDSAGPARALLRGDHITYPVGADGNGAVAGAYGLSGLPTTVFLDGRHRIVGETVGPLALGAARQMVDKLAGAGPS